MLNFFKPTHSHSVEDLQSDMSSAFHDEGTIYKNEFNTKMDVESNNTHRTPYSNEISLLTQNKQKELIELRQRFEEHIESTKKKIESKKNLITSGNGSIATHSDLNDLLTLQKTLTGNLDEQLKRISKRYDESISEVKKRYDDMVGEIQSKK